MKLAVLALIAIILGIAPARAGDWYYANGAIRLDNSTGGDIEGFFNSYMMAERANIPVVISGNCLSSCTLGLIFKNVCFMPNVVLGFHAGFKASRPGVVDPLFTSILESAVPPELKTVLKMPFKSFKLQYVKASQMPQRYICK
jgi:hypothetical protein